MKKAHKYQLALALTAAVLVAPTAHADPTTPPPTCTVKGAVCQVLDKIGTCIDSTCIQNTPEGVMSHACIVCDTSMGGAAGATAGGGVPGSAGATSNGGTPSGGTATGGAPSAGAANLAGTAGTTNSAGAPGVAGATKKAGSAGTAGMPDTSSDAGCSCSMRSLGSEQSVAAFMLGLGAVALGISRRRRP